MTPAAVIDTNVIAAGLMTSRGDAPTARILGGMLTGMFPFAISVALLAEYREVLNRPALRKRHGLKSAEVELLLVALAQNVIVLMAKAGPTAPHPGAQRLWDLLASHDGLCLVTGDRLLLQQRSAPARVVSPAEFTLQALV